MLDHYEIAEASMRVQPGGSDSNKTPNRPQWDLNRIPIGPLEYWGSICCLPWIEAVANAPPFSDRWVLPAQGNATPLMSASPAEHSHQVSNWRHLSSRIGMAGGAIFWFRGLRNCFITVAERELLLPPSLTKRLGD